MSKKFNSKLLSIILCIAICCATLCGSVIAAHAAAADFNGTYTISVGDNKQAVPFAATEVKAQVKFDLPAGFVGGKFTAKAQNNYTIGDAVKAVAGTTKDGSAFNAAAVEFDVVANGNDKDIEFVIDGNVLATSITIEYTLVINGYVNNGNTTQYMVAIDVDGANFGTEGDYAGVTFTASADSDSWFHSHSAWCNLSNAVIDSTANGKHSPVSSICHLCYTVGQLEASEYTYLQIIPDHSEFEGVTTPTIAEGATDKSPTAWIGISGVTVSYADDGTLGVDVHAYSHWRSGATDKIELLVCDENGNELQRITSVPNGSSYFAGNGFPDGEKMFTINGLSARDIDTQLYLVAVEYSSGAIEYSRTMPFCLADWCEKVVTGDGAVWADGATDAQIEADKDVAAALYYYGASIGENVFDKNTAGGGSIATTVTPVEKTTAILNVDYCNYYGTYQPDPNSSGYNPAVITWDNFITSLDATENANATGEEATPYIVTTAEQVMYLTAVAKADDTQGKYFKVSDKIGAFNFMNNASFTPATTAADVKAWTESSNNGWKYKHSVQEGAFAGTFDGNGAVFYNLSKEGNFTGLFPRINMNTTIKNVTVAASVFNTNGGYAKGSGGIFGSVNGDWNGSTITIENCNVVNCYITSQAGTYGAGAIGGYSHALVVTIDGCFVADNIITTTVSAPIGGVIATSYNANSVLKNTVVLGTTPYNTWPANHTNSEGCNFENPAHQTYNNVYTDQAKNTCYKDKENTTLREFSDAEIKVISPSDAKGANAVSNLKLDSSLYVATSGFPVLKSNYTWTPICDNEETHTYKAAVSLDGVVTNYTDKTEAHTLVDNTETGMFVCECGYSKKIIGNSVTPNNKITVAWGTGYNSNRPTTLEESGMTGSGAENDPYIIKTPAQLYYVTQRAGAASAGKYYKVSDEIAAFDLSPDASGWNLADNSCNFQGNFDGNGVELINFKGTGYHSALFPNVSGTVTIKNLKIKGAVIEPSGSNGAAIIASINGDTTTNVTVSQCVIVDTVVSAKGQAGAIVATAGNGPHLTINNCIVYNTTVTTTSTQSYDPGNCVLGLSWAADNCSISDSIILGLNPENRINNISNVYTDYAAATNANITKISDLSALKGKGTVAKLGLDSNVWFDTANYPELHAFHDMVAVSVDENTHQNVCQVYVDGAQCSVCGLVENHNLIANNEGTAKVCACGISEEIIGNTFRPNNKKVVVWDGSRPNTLEASGMKGDGLSKETAYIVETPAQLFYIAQFAHNESAGKYYRVADDVAVFDMNNINWGLSNNSAYFQGKFDGNGVEIINLKISGYHASLFQQISGDTVIENLKITNAEISSSNAGGYAAALFTTSNGTSVTLNNIAIIDCNIYNEQNTTNPLLGNVAAATNDAQLTMNNCFIKTKGDANVSVVGYIRTTGHNVSNCILINSYVSDNVTTKNNNYNQNTVVVGKGAVAAMGLDNNVWFDTANYPELHAFHDMVTVFVDENKHQTMCQDIINGVQCDMCFDAAAHDMVESDDGKFASCECGYGYEIKGINAMKLPQCILERVTSNSVYAAKFATSALFKAAYGADVYGTDVVANEFDMYTTILNLKVNPHIGFMFAFNGAYNANKANITASFVVDGQTIATVKGSEMINNAGAGRYHLYRFKSLPVSKLCKPVTVTVSYNGSTYDFGTYSAAGYAINAMNAGEEFVEHVNAAMALVFYSEMLAARANA